MLHIKPLSHYQIVYLDDFTLVAARGGACLNYFMYSLVFQSSGSQLCKINLGVCEMINVVEKKSSATKVCSNCGDFFAS